LELVKIEQDVDNLKEDEIFQYHQWLEWIKINFYFAKMNFAYLFFYYIFLYRYI
jgi:hypothetical protein